MNESPIFMSIKEFLSIFIYNPHIYPLSQTIQLYVISTPKERKKVFFFFFQKKEEGKQKKKKKEKKGAIWIINLHILPYLFGQQIHQTSFLDLVGMWV